MKVAILGAGLSGLSSAIILEQHGISPTIFEKRSIVGDRFVNGEVLLTILTKPINDTIKYLADEHQLYLKPTNQINQIRLFSENEQAQINGHLGYTNIRGRHEEAFEQQLASQINTKIHYDSSVSYEELRKDYTHIVLATGDANYALEQKNFRHDLSAIIRGATIEGEFNKTTIYVWVDHNLAPFGYAYIIPFSQNKANIAISYPDYKGLGNWNTNHYWERTIERAQEQLKQSFRITDHFEVSNYMIGTSIYPRLGNTFFAGNCYGAIMPFLGFGQFTSILTGIYAAYDIVGLRKYDQLTKPLKKSYEQSLILRKTFEKLKNPSFDFIVKHMDGTMGDKLFNPGRQNPLRLMSYLLRPFV